MLISDDVEDVEIPSRWEDDESKSEDMMISSNDDTCDKWMA